MQGNRATCQTDEKRDFYESENQHTTGNKNRNRNRYHNNSHSDKQQSKKSSKKVNGFALFIQGGLLLRAPNVIIEREKECSS